MDEIGYQVIVGWVLLAVLVGAIGRQIGKDFWLGFWLSLLLSPIIGLIGVLLIGGKKAVD